MLLKPTISRTPATDAGLDQARLYAEGLDHVRQLSGLLWTDHNTHDPGITILELACYALTDLTYRARLPLEDLLATKHDNAGNMARQFVTPRQVLLNRALTAADYRKLIIDLKGVKNAWISPARLRYVADTVQGKLRRDDGGRNYQPWERPFEVRGLYDVRIEYMEDRKTDAQRQAVRDSISALLNANRNLCEDFVTIEDVKTESYSLCAEIELTPDADASHIEAQLRFDVDLYLAPPVRNYTLEEMLAKRHADGDAYTIEEIFEGPALEHGFIDDAELAASALRTDVNLSDVISVIMDIQGVQAVRDIVVNALAPDGTARVPADKWRLKVTPGMQPRLSENHVRLVFYKRNLPLRAKPEIVATQLDALRAAVRTKLETESREDLPIPLGRFRDVGRYYSFQNHFPNVYGLSPAGLPGDADVVRRSQALQLKAYLLFFDQVMANCCAQLANVRELFARDTATAGTYFAKVVDSFRDYQRIYPTGIDDSKLAGLLETDASAQARRNRLLDHLLARFAEDFREYAGIMRSKFGADLSSIIAAKRDFLNDLLAQHQGSERGLAYNHTLTEARDLWNTPNVSGLERRLARLLGLSPARRRDLSAAPPGEEGMYLIENILLRPPEGDETFLPICVDPSCTGCFDDDPYSYRLQIVLPAFAGRFRDMDFRRFVEETIRQEMPAHLLPKICWVDAASMATIEKTFHAWLQTRVDGSAQDRKKTLADLIDALRHAKNIHPPRKMHDCDAGDDKPPFILNHHALGNQEP